VTLRLGWRPTKNILNRRAWRPVSGRMREIIELAVWTFESASVLLALVAFIVGTVWLLHAASRTERGLWDIRKGRTEDRKNPRVPAPPRRYV